MVKGLLSYEEAAHLLGKSTPTISRLVHEGKIPAQKIPGHGKRLFLKKEDVEKYLQEAITFDNIMKAIQKYLQSDTMTTQQLVDAFKALGATEVEVDGVMRNVLSAKRKMAQLREGGYLPVAG